VRQEQKLAHKKTRKKFAESNLSKSMNYWNQVLGSSDETKINLFGSDGVQHVWQHHRSTKKVVSCLQSSMVVVVVASWSGAA